MNSEVFLNRKLSSIGEFRNGANFSKKDFGEGFGIVNVKQLFSGRYASFDNLETVISSAISKPDGLFLRDGDILFARSSVKRSGSGQVCMVSNPLENLIFSGFIIRFRVTDIDNAHPEFLNYLLRSPVYRELFQRIANGTTIFNLSQDVLADVDISLPSLAYQKEIAHILGLLDDKIELNRKTNETLEGIAKALFKSWFVDFDPVRAKAEGRSTGLHDEISNLFPDSFEDSELGEIPSNWCSKKIADWGQTICGKTPSTKREEFYGDGYMFVTIPDLHKGLHVTHSSKEITQSGADSQPKKLLPKGSVLVSCIATPGLIGVAKESCFTNQQINSIIPRNRNSTWFLAFFLLMHQDLLLSFGGGGSVFFNLSKGKFDEIVILSPSENVMDAFSEVVSPLMEKCFYLKEEISILSIIRDTLLPKLITGELRIPDAEKILEEVGV